MIKFYLQLIGAVFLMLWFDTKGEYFLFLLILWQIINLQIAVHYWLLCLKGKIKSRFLTGVLVALPWIGFCLFSVFKELLSLDVISFLVFSYFVVLLYGANELKKKVKIDAFYLSMIIGELPFSFEKLMKILKEGEYYVDD